jgi:hypothetical protein
MNAAGVPSYGSETGTLFEASIMLVLKKVGSTRRTEMLNGASSAKRASERPREFYLAFKPSKKVNQRTLERVL